MKLEFNTRATKLIDSGTFANITQARDWVKKGLACHAKCLENDGAEVSYAIDGWSFVTDGGDEVEGAANWLNDDKDSAVYAEIRCRDF